MLKEVFNCNLITINLTLIILKYFYLDILNSKFYWKKQFLVLLYSLPSELYMPVSVEHLQ